MLHVLKNVFIVVAFRRILFALIRLRVFYDVLKIEIMDRSTKEVSYFAIARVYVAMKHFNERPLCFLFVIGTRN